MATYTEEQIAEAERFVQKAISHRTTREMSDHDCRAVALKVLQACRFQTSPTAPERAPK